MAMNDSEPKLGATSTLRVLLRWSLFSAMLLAFILVPFFLLEDQLNALVQDTLQSNLSVALITLAGRPRSEGVQTGTAPRMGNPQQADLQFEFPYGPATANMYAMAARRHMHQYGTTSASRNTTTASVIRASDRFDCKVSCTSAFN